jgi:predicted lipoprotein with Yx(FWY)xxD motif
MTPILAGTVALAVAGCGGGGGGNSSKQTPSKSTSGALVDTNGMALYTPAGETASNVRCTGACVAIWKPVKPGDVKAAAGAKLGSITRPDGTKQATANGKPLYTFAQDSPGTVNGNGASDAFGGKQFTWHVVTPGGASSGSAPASKSSSKSNYGY